MVSKNNLKYDYPSIPFTTKRLFRLVLNGELVVIQMTDLVAVLLTPSAQQVDEVRTLGRI